MDPYSAKGLEEKIATIRATLKRLGNSLEDEDFDKQEISHSKSSQDSNSSISNSFHIPAAFDALKNHIQESYTPEDHWEPPQTFDYEKNNFLENQLKEKEQKIQDLLFIQSELKETIEKNTEDLHRCRQENFSFQQQLENLTNENNGLRRILDEKDIEIGRNKSEIENLKKEKEIRNREWERTKRQAEKVDELLDEINRLKDLNLLLKSKGEENKKEVDNSKLVNSYQQQLNVRDSQINELEKERLVLLKEIDRIKAESQSPMKSSRDFNYLEATRESTLTQPLIERAQSGSSLSKEMMKIVGVSHRKDLYSKVLHLHQFHEKFKKDKKILNNMTKLIIDCSPLNTFDKSPNVHQIWKWLTNILEEYMKIKKSPNQKVINELCEIFSAEAINLVEKVKDVIAENYKLKKSRSQEAQAKGRKLS